MQWNLSERDTAAARFSVDQGEADNFLQEQLKPELLSSVCVETGQPLQLRMQPGYDHSYYFIASFIEDHIAFHASNLN